MSESLYVSFLLAEPGFEPGIQTRRQLSLQNEHIHCATPQHQKKLDPTRDIKIGPKGASLSHRDTSARYQEIPWQQQIAAASSSKFRLPSG